MPGAGLSREEAARRLREHGPNLLPQPDRRRALTILLDVLKEPMLLLLVGAATLYLLLGTPRDAIVLLVSIVGVVAITVYQEGRSEHALQALRDLSNPQARVLRDGAPLSIPAAELVPGDLLLVAEGDRLPADARLLEAREVLVDESLLSGESVAVARFAGAGDEALLSAGTLMVRGRGSAEVVATGLATAMGRIGTGLQDIGHVPTPLQREMRRVVLAFVALSAVVSSAVVVLHFLAHGAWLPALLAGITLAISTIPEEFPVVLAVFLALGSWRMARHRALVRRAVAIEALGAITVLCTDKTGTLTENRMAVQELAVGAQLAPLAAATTPELLALLAVAELACEEHPHDPMELAFRKAAAPALAADRAQWQRVRDYPLSDALLAVTHVWRAPGEAALRVACKGAPEAVAALCALDAGERAAILQLAADMAARGMRVLAAADALWAGEATTLPDSPAALGLRWRGLLGLADPLREGVADAVAEARGAGIRVLMLTGDHPETARAIALQAGLDASAGARLGASLETGDAATLRAAIAGGDVFARVKPAQKLRLVQSLRADGQVVAMTGDGVNDAPALMAADVGIAMGLRGTDVARESSDMVLLDDNFLTIVRAVRMGRGIYDNIARALRYILAVHVPITGLALLPLLFGAPMILLPVHVVFLEMIIDPASTLVFEREPPQADAMRRPPRPPTQRLLGWRSLLASLLQGAAAFAAIALLWWLGRDAGLPAAQLGALCFVALVVGNVLLIAANLHHGRGRRMLANPAFLVVATLALLLLGAVTRLPVPAAWFGFAPPPLDWSLLAAALPAGTLLLHAGAERLWRGPRHA